MFFKARAILFCLIMGISSAGAQFQVDKLREFASIGSSASLGARTYFFAMPVNGTSFELWATNGKFGGTKLIGKIGANPARPGKLLICQKRILAHVENELWEVAGLKATPLLTLPTPIREVACPAYYADQPIYLLDDNSIWLLDRTHPKGSEVFSNKEIGGIRAHGYLIYFLYPRKDHTSQDHLTLGVIQTDTGGVFTIGSFDNHPQYPANSAGYPPYYKWDGFSLGLRFVVSVNYEFFSHDIPRTTGVWSTNGTTSSTGQILPYYGSGLAPHHLSTSKDRSRALYLQQDPAHGVEPWITDGTSAGTSLIKDLSPGTASSRIYPIGAVKDKSLFTTLEANSYDKTTLWLTDGSAGGTKSE